MNFGMSGVRPAGGGGGGASSSLVGIQTWKRKTACTIPYNFSTVLEFHNIAEFDEIQIDGSPVVDAQASGLIVQPGVSLIHVVSQLYVGTTAEVQAGVWKNSSLYARGRNVGRSAVLDTLVDVAPGDVLEIQWFHLKSGGAIVYDPALTESSVSPFFATIEGYNT